MTADPALATLAPAEAGAGAAAPLLRTEDLGIRFGGLAALNGVNFELPRGEIRAVIGPNGAGKSTFFNCLTGVLRPSAGRILLEGEDITVLEASKRVRRGLARTFQINQLFLDLTPLETVGLAISERMGLGEQWWRLVGSNQAVTSEIVEILGRFHLTDVMYERTGNLPYAGLIPTALLDTQFTPMTIWRSFERAYRTESLRQAAATTPYTADIYTLRGILALEAGDIPHATAMFRKVLDVNDPTLTPVAKYYVELIDANK